MADLNKDKLFLMQALLLSSDYLATVERKDAEICRFRMPGSLKRPEMIVEYKVERYPEGCITKTIGEARKYTTPLPQHLLRPAVLASIYNCMRIYNYHPSLLFCFVGGGVTKPLSEHYEVMSGPTGDEDKEKEEMLLRSLQSLAIYSGFDTNMSILRENGLTAEYESLKQLYLDDGEASE